MPNDANVSTSDAPLPARGRKRKRPPPDGKFGRPSYNELIVVLGDGHSPKTRATLRRTIGGSAMLKVGEMTPEGKHVNVDGKAMSPSSPVHWGPFTSLSRKRKAEYKENKANTDMSKPSATTNESSKNSQPVSASGSRGSFHDRLRSALPKTRQLKQTMTLKPSQSRRSRVTRRCPSNIRVFAGHSPNEVATRLGLPAVDPEQKQSYEYLHLIAFSMKGNKAQVKENLVLGSYHTNTNMMYIEKAVKQLHRKKYRITLEVTATIDCSTEERDTFQLAKEIHYKIIVDGFDQPLEFFFYPLQHQQPNYDIQKVVDAYVARVEERSQQSVCRALNF